MMICLLMTISPLELVPLTGNISKLLVLAFGSIKTNSVFFSF